LVENIKNQNVNSLRETGFSLYLYKWWRSSSSWTLQ